MTTETGLRDWLLQSSAVTVLGYIAGPYGRSIRGASLLFSYGSDHPSHSRRTLMDVDAQVTKWLEVIVGLGTAHSKDDVDGFDYQLDDLYEPVLAAPVAQLREFYRQLSIALKKDSRVPYIVWRSWETWSTQILDAAPDQDVIELRESLARDIAERVEKDVQPDITDAIFNALKWRPAEQLEAVQRELREGKKPRVRGRESCLYLEVGDALVML